MWLSSKPLIDRWVVRKYVPIARLYYSSGISTPEPRNPTCTWCSSVCHTQFAPHMRKSWGQERSRIFVCGGRGVEEGRARGGQRKHLEGSDGASRLACLSACNIQVLLVLSHPQPQRINVLRALAVGCLCPSRPRHASPAEHSVAYFIDLVRSFESRISPICLHPLPQQGQHERVQSTRFPTCLRGMLMAVQAEACDRDK